MPRAWAEVVRRNTSLTILRLHSCGIGDEGLGALGGALRANSTLETLFLRYNCACGGAHREGRPA